MRKSKPREKTREEIQEEFLGIIWNAIDFWEKEASSRNLHERLGGLAFSILNILDGTNGAICGFVVAPLPHSGDMEYQRKRGQNWMPFNKEKGMKDDIAGDLHKKFYSIRPKGKSE